MNGSAPERLYSLLPAVYRIRDAEQGEPLRALLAVMETQLQALEQDIAGLYENWFIETCAEWVVPYIGDLLRVRRLNPVSAGTFSERAYVAHTLGYRRRKGTTAMLEQLARDVTGWPARVVEFFELLCTTQYLNHIRLDNIIVPDLRGTDRLERLAGPFEQISHTLDVRHIDQQGGKYNTPNLGIFLWRLQSYPVTNSTARAAAASPDGRYRFNPLGLDAPLFNQPQTPGEFERTAGEINVPGPLRRRAVYDDLEAVRQAIVDNNAWAANKPYGVGDEIVDSNGNLEAATLAGASGATAPAWPTVVGGTVTDGTVTWQLVATGFRSAWAANKAFGLGAQVVDSNGNTQRVITAGTTAGDPPVWPTEVGVTTTDGTVTWQLVSLVSSSYFGASPVLQVKVDTAAVPPEQIMVCDLSDLVSGDWRRPPATKSYTPSSGGPPVDLPIQVSVDPALGRLAFPTGVVPSQVQVSYSYGFSGDLGGGPYNRSDSLSPFLTAATPPWQVAVTKELAPDGKLIFSKLTDALTHAATGWNAQPPGTFGIIAVLDSQSYAESPSITIPEGSQLLIVAASWPGVGTSKPGQLLPEGVRPHLLGNVAVTGTAGATSPLPGTLILNGLMIEGALEVLAGNLGSLQLAHCTLTPGGGGLQVASEGAAGQDNGNLIVSLNRTISAPLALASSVPQLAVVDSIVDAVGSAAITAPGAAVNIQTSTLLGTTGALSLEAGNSIFTGPVTAQRAQIGCLRFCYVPPPSQTARRYRCQPDLALKGVTDPNAQNGILARLTPQFTSATYGQPGYAQLSLASAQEISTGAEDGSEIGAFDFLKQPQRVANLGVALEEYQRFGLEAGTLYVT